MREIPIRHGKSTGPGLAQIPVLLGIGCLYGLVEYVWQRWVSATPAGLPGDGGPDLVANLALGASVFGVPALLAALLLLRARRAWAPWLVWVAAVAPTLVLVIDRLATRLRWTWAGTDAGGWGHYAWLGGLTLASAAVGASLARLVLHRVVPALVRPPRAVAVLGLVLTVAAPSSLALLLRWDQTGGVRATERSERGVADSRPNVLLVTIDTLRQDALGIYGGPSTPHLDDWIGDGVRFDGWSVSSWTRPSMGALFSGVGPTGNGGGQGRALNPETAWWVETLRDEGWSTAAIVSNPHLRRRFGFDRGFQWFDHSDEVEQLAPVARTLWGVWISRQLIERGQAFRGDHMVQRAAKWLAEAATGSSDPWLLWVHTMDPHLPYHLRGEDGSLVDLAPGSWIDALGSDFDAERQRFFDLPGARDGSAVVTPEARGALRRLYQREVAFTDHWMGRLRAAAQRAGNGRPLLWVLTSDHGEEFWDERGFEHGHSLHASVLRVPLALGGLERLEPGTQGGPMTLSDVGPTLMGLLGLRGADPGRGVELDDAEPELVRRVVGHDRLAVVAVASGGDDQAGCRAPETIAEGILYGPPRTRVLHADGSGVVRDDDAGAITRRQVCAEEDVALAQEASQSQGAVSDSLAVLEQTLLLSVDLWRRRAADLGIEVQHDPELDRRLRALGYVR